MKKRCEKGKSCGATCIDRREVCRKDLPKKVSEGLSKATDKAPKGLSKLDTAEDFRLKEDSTEEDYSPRIVQMNAQFSSLLRGEELHRSLGDGDVDKGKSIAKSATLGIRLFTGDYHDEMRQAQRETGDPKYLKMVRDIEKVIGSKEVDKPSVEKFRGVRVDSDSLKGMIESAKTRGEFDGKALASWSTSLSIARGFADEDTNDGRKERVVLRAINAKGVPIENLSSSKGEYEILTSGSAGYKYINYRRILEGGEIYHVFDVEET